MNKFLVYISSSLTNTDSLVTILNKISEIHEVIFFVLPHQANSITGIPVVDRHDKINAMLVFGGDGTILRAVKHALKLKVPILGVNLGHLGFLSEISLPELEKSIVEITSNKYKILSRMMLKVMIKKNDKSIQTGLALNDAVLSKGDRPTLINLRVYSDRRYVFSTRCDGIIAASPTGSTAYSLSAGGPIITPVMDAIVVVPITPHVLTVRPMVFPSGANISFVLEEETEFCWLQLDGQNFSRLNPGEKVTITSAPLKVDFIKLSNRTFYKTLRTKMHLGKK